jgi:flagellin
MALSDISLTSGMRSNLLNLQTTATLLDRTQTRLSTGKKVNTALDDPVNFFKAQSYTNRASDLSGFKDGMSNAIQAIKAADTGITAITALLNSAKSIAEAARTATDTATLTAQFTGILDQISKLATDSTFGGANLLGASSLVVQLGESGTLTIASQNNTVSGTVGGVGISSALTAGSVDNVISQVNGALAGLRTASQNLSSNLTIVSTRQDFTTNMISTLKTGADNLTLADMNEEGANMLMLQTRQSLGVTALSLSSQAAQSVLKLFG